MNDIDWTSPARLLTRTDDGSDLHYHFDLVREGGLAVLVREVMDASPQDRARMVIDAGPLGTLAVAEILALGGRADFSS